MIKNKYLIFIFFLLINFNSHSNEDIKTKKIYKKLLSKADQLYSERENFDKAKNALVMFKQYNEKLPNETQGLWRLSMGYYYVGHLLEGKENRFIRKEYYQKGIDAGKKCEKLSSSPMVECYFWQATNLALLEQEKGVVSLAFSLNEIIELLEKAKDIDSSYASAGAYRTLSILYSKAPGFLGGDDDKALRYIDMAIKIAPNEPLNIVFYAKLLIDKEDKQKALLTISDFIKKADPQKFSFLESKNAYIELNYYLKHEQWSGH